MSLHPETRFVVTIHFEGSAARASAVLHERPDLAAAIQAAARRHHLVQATRLVGDGQFLEIDEWRREEDRDAFVEDAGGDLAQWAHLAGMRKVATHLWRPSHDGEHA
jgi:hypothetical protein